MGIITANVNPRYKLYNQVYLQAKSDNINIAGSPRSEVDQEPSSGSGADFGLFVSDANPARLKADPYLLAKGQSAGFVNLVPGGESTSLESRLKFAGEVYATGDRPPKRQAQAITYGYSTCESVAQFQGTKTITSFMKFDATGFISNGVTVGTIKLGCKIGRSSVVGTYTHSHYPNPNQHKWQFTGTIYQNNQPVTVNQTYTHQQLPNQGMAFYCDEVAEDEVFLQTYCNSIIGDWHWLTGTMNAYVENGNLTGIFNQADFDMTFGSTALLESVS